MALAPCFSRFGHDDFLNPFNLDRVWDPFESFGLVEKTPARSVARDAFAVAGTRVDWQETPESHIFKADLPGLRKEEVKVEIVDDDVLTISGERSKEEVKKTDKWHHVERSHGQFLRKFRLPKNVKLDQVSAEVDKGVLTVTIPKVEEKKTEAHKIDVD